MFCTLLSYSAIIAGERKNVHYYIGILAKVGKIEEDTNPDSLSDSLTLDIGDIRDISISVPSSDLLKDDFKFPDGLMPPQTILPMRIPREPLPTFFRLAVKLP